MSEFAVPQNLPNLEVANLDATVALFRRGGS